jgi:DNA-binding transcriptional ArsR family regulator
VRLDPRSLRGLAHPLRVQLLGELRLHGAATASQLAERLGQSSGATSYHLRQLATYGFVVEEETRGTTRERWWEAAHRSTYFDSALTDETRVAGAEYLRAVVRGSSDRMLRFVDSVDTVADDFGPDWADAYTLSDWAFDLTAERAREMGAELTDLAGRYRTDGPAEGTRKVVLQAQLLPLPDRS